MLKTLTLGPSGTEAETPDPEMRTPPDRVNEEIVLQQTERRMREALGVQNGTGRQGSHQHHAVRHGRTVQHASPGSRPHRFVQDGEVPVTVIPPRRDQPGSDSTPAAGSPALRAESAETALGAERRKRTRLERSLQEAEGLVRELQTKLGHAELARNEALALAASWKAALERVQADRSTQAKAAAPVLDQTAPAPREGARPAAPRKTVAARKAREPRPVRWWIKPKA